MSCEQSFNVENVNYRFRFRQRKLEIKNPAQFAYMH